MVSTENLDRELSRLESIGQVTAARFTGIYLTSTHRMLSTELFYLRRAGKGPRYICATGNNGHRGYYYDFKDLLRFFGGREALYHRDDRPDLFPHETSCPSMRFARRRGAV